MAIVEINQNGKIFEIDVPEGQDIEEAVNQVTAAEGGQASPALNASSLKAVTENPAFAENPLIGGPIRIREGIQRMTDGGADEITKSLTTGGIDPNIAAAVGKAFKLLPTVGEMAVGGIGAGKAASAGAKAVVNSGIGKAVRKTGEKEAMQLAENIAELPLKQAAKKGLVDETLQNAKTGIQKAEEGAGIGLKQLGGVNQKIVTNKESLSKFAELVGRLADRPVETLAKADIKKLQMLRKTAQEGLKNSGNLNDLSRVQLAKANKVFGEAIAKKEPQIGEAMSKYKEIQDVINKLPAGAKRERQLLQAALVKAKNLAKRQADTRKNIAKGAIGVGLAFGGSKLLGL